MITSCTLGDGKIAQIGDWIRGGCHGNPPQEGQVIYIRSDRILTALRGPFSGEFCSSGTGYRWKDSMEQYGDSFQKRIFAKASSESRIWVMIPEISTFVSRTNRKLQLF